MGKSLAEKRAYQLEWQRNMRRRFAEKHGFSTASNYANGGARKTVLERDGHACVRCGMTDAEHKATFSRPITVDHKDRNKKNNAINNLQTLCLPCHGKKDLTEKLKERALTPQQAAEAAALRRDGFTYQKIADLFGINISTAWVTINKYQAEG